MTPNRTNLRLAVGALVLLLAAPSFAQDLGGLQLFAPADISPYGRGPQPHEGFFFSYDELYWNISPPKTTRIGDPVPQIVTYNVVANAFPPPAVIFLSGIQTSTVDTGLFDAPFEPGPRVEFGRVVEHHGWFVSTYRLNNQTQDPMLLNVDVNFQDPSGLLFGTVGTVGGVNYIGIVPTHFNILTVSNEMDHWSVEANYLYRTGPMHNGSFFEFFLGPRYMEFNEEFLVMGQGGPLDYSFWDTTAQNHVVGGQLGLRWFKKYSRFMFSTEGRAFAGYNAQNFTQNAVLGGYLPFYRGLPHYPDSWEGSHATSHDFRGEWAPAAELRAEFRYQLTRSISLRAGYNAFWMDGVARAARTVIYRIPEMGINASDNREGIFVNGISVGLDINR